MIKVAIIGATGYTGLELIKILNQHPKVDIVSLTAKIEQSLPIDEIFPELKGRLDILCEPFSIKDNKNIDKADVIFLAVPHGVSLDLVAFFFNKGKKIIDLSADYRLNDIDVYKKWYGISHNHSDILKNAVYGLPEFYKNEISDSNLIANPGCFPTGILLAVLPIIKELNLDPGKVLFIDSKTGTSGAGRRGSLSLSFSELYQNVKAYKINEHQHSPEISQQINLLSDKNLDIVFVPHLIPVKRGIINTIYLSILEKLDIKNIEEIYFKYYKHSKFVKFLGLAENIALINVINTNNVHIGVKIDNDRKILVIVSAIDNLIKGAAGQAVQNMNIMYNLDEYIGLI